MVALWQAGWGAMSENPLLTTALDEAAAARAVERLSPQAALLDLPAERVERIKRAPGRPRGSVSRRTERTAQELLDRFGDPLMRQIAVATMPLREMVDLGFTVQEAMVEQRLAAAVVLPYLHQRQAVAVDVTAHKTVTLTIVTGLDEPMPTSAAPIIDIEEIQEVSYDAPDAV